MQSVNVGHQGLYWPTDGDDRFCFQTGRYSRYRNTTLTRSEIHAI